MKTKIKNYMLIFLFLLIILFSLIFLTKSLNKNSQGISNLEYPLHKNITVTIFWVGESASEENDFISNSQSAWDSNWEENYGGIDNPDSRERYFPKEFTPNENPFYFALPYNDFTDSGKRKENSKLIYWYDDKTSSSESFLKNKWIKIIKNNKTVYAQWEDSGPFQYDDVDYVFGYNNPKNKFNNNTGLDVSPAVRDYLELEDIDKIDWQFADFSEVPEGPWTEIMTFSQINWN